MSDCLQGLLRDLELDDGVTVRLKGSDVINQPKLTTTASIGEKRVRIVIHFPRSVSGFLHEALQGWRRLKTNRKANRKRLRVCESISLGEKRFISVVQVDGAQFLVGGAANSVCMLARLDAPSELPELLQQRELDRSFA
jgi:sRNA-binding carbon storage regulator CsrA